MVIVLVSAGFKDNAPALLVVEPIIAHLALDHALQRISHTPQPGGALSELGLACLEAPPPTLEQGTLVQ